MKKFATLSEAALAGAKLHPKAIGNYAAWTSRTDYSTCFLGAAFEAVYAEPPEGGDIEERIESALEVSFLDKEVPYPNPRPGERPSGTVTAVIIYLNDTLGWSREEIATYLQGFGL